MRSRTKRNWLTAGKWAVYGLLLLAAVVLQTMPGLSLLGIKPVFILPLCLTVALTEGEFYGALFGTVGGLLWDWAAGRTAGLFAITLLAVCFFASILFQLYLRNTAANFGLLSGLAGWVVLTLDHLFFYVMPGYAVAAVRYAAVVLPMVVLCWLAGLIDRYIVLRAQRRFDPEEEN